MQIVALGDNQSLFSEKNKGKYIKLSSAETLTQHAER